VKKRQTGVLIGAGMVAKTHVLACAAARHSMRLKGIVGRNPARLDALVKEASRLMGEEIIAYRSLDDVVDDAHIDFAILVTPPDVRASIIEPLARAGKHILLEKPVARNAHEAAQLIKICRQYGVTLGIVFQHRMRAASIAAQKLIASGRLGALALCEILVPWWRPQSYYDEPGRGTLARDGGGVLISQAIHTIDLALSLAGPVGRVRAMAATTRFHRMEGEDFVCAGLQFKNGAVGSLTASTASFPGAPESITLHYDKASLRLACGLLHVDWRDGEREIFGQEASGTGGGADPMAFSHEWHQGIVENFVDALNSSKAPLVTGEEALLSHQLIDGLMASAKSGGEIDVV